MPSDTAGAAGENDGGDDVWGCSDDDGADDDAMLARESSAHRARFINVRRLSVCGCARAVRRAAALVVVAALVSRS